MTQGVYGVMKCLVWTSPLLQSTFCTSRHFLRAKDECRTPRRQNLQMRNQENDTTNWFWKFKSGRKEKWTSCTRDIANLFFARLNKPLLNLFFKPFGKKKKSPVGTIEIFYLLTYYSRVNACYSRRDPLCISKTPTEQLKAEFCDLFNSLECFFL